MMTSVNHFSFVEPRTTSWYFLHGFVWFVSPLHMYLLLLVAGTSAYMSLRSRTPGQFALERIKRLLVPLLTFMVFLFPVLGYFWPPAQYALGLPYLTQFWPWCLSTTFYSPITGGPNWGHMWFVGYLFIYSIVLLPLLLRTHAGKCRWTEPVTWFLTSGRGKIFIPGIPIALTYALLSPIWPFFRNNLYSDWGYFTYNMTAFLFGFMIARDRRWTEAFARHATWAIIFGVILSAVKMYMQYAGLSTPSYDARYAFYSLVAGMNTWCWVIAVLSIARKKLAFTNRFLKYFNRISYPFYIFHLVVISAAGYFITRLRLGTVLEFLVLCAVSFILSVLCCELGKRVPLTRFLLGIKGK
jgi:peptidoglycan/LPS O-acetylase OafA/YrhL